ncbi:hypothetical protein [Mesorhizobium sp. B2-3-4]|uniref:hypothetical protein n=1 Tax=Mesorhizobium sp. B2-3-4 TaxID=2589959 RepID=UPI00112BF33F|nr:hypothetical protein [Mesorhizobium sp. B2-3-4]TPM41551.1 hypothetical protein FJ967_01040 [Mesorhizobium sp. B2-3-4]
MKHPVKSEKAFPSQIGADSGLAHAKETASEPSPKSKAKAANPDTPYPTQADLDAIKDGSFHGREAKSEGDNATYKTR